MRFRTLGSMQVWDGAAWAPVRAPQQRTVLAVLLIEAGRSVSTDRLVDEIWGAQPPRAATSTIQVYVMRLRRLLDRGGSSLVTRGRGYQLLLDDGDLDAAVFARLVESSRRLVTEGRLATAVEQLSEALALWRGPALADVPPSPAISLEAARLEQARLGAVEARLGAELNLGRHAEVVDELHMLVDQHPLRERLRAQLMRALYRCGRRGEALSAYRSGRTQLIAELGLEPGAELRELERAILADDPALSTGAAAPPEPPTGEAPPAVRVVPAQLPADVPAFTGRGAPLRRLDALLPAAGGGPPVVVISTIAGAGGVGKTALAVHWAHRVRDRFPDGQLHVNLRGYAAVPPLRPIDALAGFLAALGVPADEIPADEARAAALYRSLLAGRRMLVVLDNANHPDQVRPLLPGTAGSLVLVTSRARLAGLAARDGATGLDLDVLTPAEAQTLLTRMLGAERATAEPDALAELARLCGHLPLALRIAAANLDTHPGWTIAGYTARLRTDRLAGLQVDGDEQAAVRGTFDLSYVALPAGERRLLRLLGLVPGPDVTADAAAALADRPPADTARLLERLAGGHLLDEPVHGRYAMHDLTRLYAADRATAEDRETERAAALRRLFDHYLQASDAAGAHLPPLLAPLPRPATTARPVPALRGRAEATAWLDGERPNLVAAARYAAAHGPRDAAWLLADALSSYFDIRGHAVDWEVVSDAGMAAAEADGDARARAAMHLNLGALRGRQSRFREAVEHYDRVLALAAEAGWADGRPAALGRVGNMHWELGDLERAAECHLEALALNRAAGRRHAQATNHSNVGLVYWQLGRIEEAADEYAQALALYELAGSRGAEGNTYGNLADAYQALGRFDEARASAGQALDVHREIGNRMGESTAVLCLATIDRDLGRHADAHGQATTAVTMAAGIGDRRIEADARNVLATVELCLGRADAAVDGQRRALALSRNIGNRYGEANALVGLAAAHRYAGRCGEAAEHARQALQIAGPAGYAILEGQALTVAAAIHLHEGRLDLAAADAKRALALHRRTGHRLGRARANLVLAAALPPERAQDHRHDALADFSEIGADPAGHAAVLLPRPAGALPWG